MIELVCIKECNYSVHNQPVSITIGKSYNAEYRSSAVYLDCYKIWDDNNTRVFCDTSCFLTKDEYRDLTISDILI